MSEKMLHWFIRPDWRGLMFGLGTLLATCAPPPAPTATPTLVPSLTPSMTPDIQIAVDLTLTALAPTGTPAPPTQTPIVVTLPPVVGQAFEVPLDITLPADWTMIMNDALVIGDLDAEIRGIPFIAYRGPITGGTGTIVVLWGFPNLTTVSALTTQQAPDLWADGLRLLRVAVIEQGCNIGTDLQRSYRVGLLPAVGTQFAAVDCPESADTRGWFAGLQEGGLNFVFYTYADPIEAMDTGQDELQAILDTVRFHVVPAAPETGG